MLPSNSQYSAVGIPQIVIDFVCYFAEWLITITEISLSLKLLSVIICEIPASRFGRQESLNNIQI